jgi:hypothetical protein
MINISLLDSIRESFGRVVYTHKAHEKMADRLATTSTVFKWAELILIALTAGSTIKVIVSPGRPYDVVSAILASLTLLITIYQFRFNSDQVIQAHRTAAKKLWLVREKYIALITDLCANAIDSNMARQQRDALVQEVYAVYDAAPSTNSRAYKAAQKALKINEEMTFADNEIDLFLPASLHKTK